MVDEWIEQSVSVMKTVSNSSDAAAVTSKPSLKNKLGKENLHIIELINEEK